MTHTYATMDVSISTFNEIMRKLKEADYHQALHGEGDALALDMHGIALTRAVMDVSKPTCLLCGKEAKVYDDGAMNCRDCGLIWEFTE